MKYILLSIISKSDFEIEVFEVGIEHLIFLTGYFSRLWLSVSSPYIPKAKDFLGFTAGFIQFPKLIQDSAGQIRINLVYFYIGSLVIALVCY